MAAFSPRIPHGRLALTLLLLAAAGGMPIDALELVDDPASRRAPVEEIARLLCAADAAHGGEPSALSIAIAALRHGATPERAGSLLRAGDTLPARTREFVEGVAAGARQVAQ